MHNLATLPRTSAGSFAVDSERVPTTPSYDVSSGWMPMIPSDDDVWGDRASLGRRSSISQFADAVVWTALAATFAAGIAGDPVEARAWSTDDFSAGQDVSPPLPSDYRSVLSNQIMAYGHLPEDWDGEGGVAPSKEAVDDALAFMELLPLSGKLPKSMVSGDGEVGFYWKTDSAYIDVSFFGDGKIVYYGRAMHEGLEAQGAPHFSRSNLPKDLLEVISRV
jgi:hypothetical protein